jgi:hypothetical protein
MLGVPRPYTTPCGLLKQPDKQMIGSAANLAVQGGVKRADGEAVQGFELNGESD